MKGLFYLYLAIIMTTYFKYLKDIRFWLILFFIIRLYGITNPPLDVAHNWRQTTVTMVARNYLEFDSRILYPRIDVCGEKSGITGMEFPIFNYLIFIISKLFGYQHWYGRAINLIISTIGIWFFYEIIRKYLNKNHAFASAMLLLGSIWFVYSRKIMPDTFAVSLVFIGIYYGLKYFYEKPAILNIALYTIFMLLGILAKLPMGYFLMVFAIPMFQKSISLKLKIVFGIVNLSIIGVVSWYYFRWVPYLIEHYGLKHFFMGKSITVGLIEIMKNWHSVLEKYYLDSMHITGFLLFLGGCWYAWKFRKTEPITIWILGLCTSVFFLLMFKSGETFAIHSYYIVPYAPIMAFVAGFAVTKLNYKWMPIILSIVIVENIANWQHDFRIKPEFAKFENLEKDLDKHGSRNDLIFVNSKEVPTPLYFAHRKGWSDHNHFVQNPQYVDSLQKLGLKYIVIAKKAFGSATQLNYPKIDSNDVYDIYKLK